MTLAFDSPSSPAAAPAPVPRLLRVAQALACLSSGGWSKMTTVGIIPEELPVPVSWGKMIGRNWHSTLMGGAKRQDVARFVEWFVEGKLDLGEMVSQTLSIDDVNEGFELMRQGKTNRAVILYR